MEKDLEICVNRTAAMKAVEKINPLDVKEIIKYEKMGCYQCDGKDKEMDCYKK